MPDMRELTLSALERAGAAEAGQTLAMDEEAFRALYERTARPLWAYLVRSTGDRHAADDLLQETYFRFVRAGHAHASDAHRRHSLFRIAANLVRDRRRRRSVDCVPLVEDAAGAAPDRGDAEQRTAVHRALESLKPRDRDLLWLAYAMGSTHEQIGRDLGVKTSSVKLLLFRARRRFLALLRGGRPEDERGGR